MNTMEAKLNRSNQSKNDDATASVWWRNLDEKFYQREYPEVKYTTQLTNSPLNSE